MRYSGLMPSDTPAVPPGPKLINYNNNYNNKNNNQHRRIPKHIVFKIGETIHSGPTTHVSRPPHRHEEDLTTTTTTTTTSRCVFPANQHLTTPASPPDSTADLAQIPSTVPSSPQSSQSYYLGTHGSLPTPVPLDSSKALTNQGPPAAPQTCTHHSSAPTSLRRRRAREEWAAAVRRTEVGRVRRGRGRPRKSKVVQQRDDSKEREQPPPAACVEELHLMIKKEPDDSSSLLYGEEKEPSLISCSIEPDLSRVKTEAAAAAASLMPEIYEAKYPELNKGRLLIRVQRTPINVTNSSSLAHHTKENKEMVRLVQQEQDAKLDLRSSRTAAKRITAAGDFGVIEIKPEPVVSRLRRCTRTRKCSCRSDKSESETSDSRSVADDNNLYFDVVERGSAAARLKPRNGEALPDDTTAVPPQVTAAKCNGEGSELQNGTHRVKGRRVSRANSDESDGSNTGGAKMNGSVEQQQQNGDKVEFSSLLEMSPDDRKKFESKKAKIRRKTADWQLISETERYYSEKEEIMRNKNKNESDSESEEDSECSEDDSRSESSNHSDGGNKKDSKPDHHHREEEEAGVGVKQQQQQEEEEEEDGCVLRKRSRPIGSRTRKTLYDLTMLNDDDDDDDENFFGFPVSTTIPQRPQPACGVTTTTTSSSSSSSSQQTRSKTKESSKQQQQHQYDLSGCSSSSSTKVGRKRLSDAERFLRDNREYYHFQETTERLRRSTSSSSDKVSVRLEEEGSRKDEPRPKDPAPPPPPPAPPETKKQTPATDLRRVTRSAGCVAMAVEPEQVYRPRPRCGVKSAYKRRVCGAEVKRKCCDDDEDVDSRKSVCEEGGDGGRRRRSARRISSSGDECKSEAKESENRTSDGSGECVSESDRTKVCDSECGGESVYSKSEAATMSELNSLYFSFEGVPERESWYQTYQRLIDGNANNQFVWQEEPPLRFVLPYEMPKEYVRDFLCYKKGLLAKKKSDLAELVRKSPRCHASTLALFSDILPSKRAKNAKMLRSAPTPAAKLEDQTSSDGTSTPGGDSTKLPPPGESFETTEELAILALHIDHIMKAEGQEGSGEGLATQGEASAGECKKTTTPLRKRGKRRRGMATSKDNNKQQQQQTCLLQDYLPKEYKLFDSSLAQEVDPVFLAGLCDDAKDFLIPENILAREAAEVVEDSSLCVCTDGASCDDLSSADDNTEVSSECVSLCDSETTECVVSSEPKRAARSATKKRRKNLTGWPKAQKRKKVVQCHHLSDDNDSALGWDDLEPKKHRGVLWRSKHHHHHHHRRRDFSNLLAQTTSERLAALAASDRRASPRKKSSVLYMDTWPVRFRSHK